jgi:Glycosyltransferase family 87
MKSSSRWSNRVKAIVFGVGIALALQTGGNWFRILTDRVPECGQPNCVADFVTFYAQAKLFWQEPRSLYDLDRQLAHQKTVAPTERVLPFVYPPITAALMAPLALLSFPAAFLLVTILNLLLILASLRLLTTRLSLTADQSHWLLLFALCNFGAQAVVFYGQTSAIILYCLTRHVLAEKRSQDAEAGFWAGLLSVKPQYLPIPHLVFLLTGKWRGFLIGAAISGTLIAGAFLLVGIETSKQYFDLARRMVAADDEWWNQWRSMHNLRALTIYWLPAAWQPYLWCIGVALVLAALIARNLCREKNAAGFALTWIINLLGVLIVIPHLFTHDLSLLILPCALFISLFRQRLPLVVAVGLMIVAALPAVNYAAPTSTAITLLILFMVSVAFGSSRLTRS